MQDGYSELEGKCIRVDTFFLKKVFNEVDQGIEYKELKKKGSIVILNFSGLLDTSCDLTFTSVSRHII